MAFLVRPLNHLFRREKPGLLGERLQQIFMKIMNKKKLDNLGRGTEENKSVSRDRATLMGLDGSRMP